MTYEYIKEEIGKRLNLGLNEGRENWRFQYSLPGSEMLNLQNDLDLRFLISGAQIYDQDCVRIVVTSDSQISKARIMTGNTGVEDEEVEDDMLGIPFRNELAQSFLSDDWRFYIQHENQRFTGGMAEFRDKLRKYAVSHGFKYVFLRNDGKYAEAVCENMGTEQCHWQIRGSVSSVDGHFYINELINEHNCIHPHKTEHPYLNSELVMSCIEKDVLYNIRMSPKEIISKFKCSYGYDITYKVALLAKRKAVDKIYGSAVESFNKLTWYRQALMSSNPGSIYELEVDSSTNRFKRLFLAFSGCISGFQFCLPLLYVDGTFGKSMYKGQVLGATGRNGNKELFPLAICVCDSESEDNWNFFFQNLKRILQPQGRVVTFISDRGIGLLSAFDRIFPLHPHLYCYKHLAFNLGQRYKGKGQFVSVDEIRSLFFKCAYSSTEREYLHNLSILRRRGGETIIDSFIAEIPVQHWVRAYFPGLRYGVMANGIAESFNSWIEKERAMPVFSMLDHIRRKVMGMHSKRFKKCKKWTTVLTPNMEKMLAKVIRDSRPYNILSATERIYEVRHEHTYSVDLNAWTCSCVKWQINCFPCAHATAVILKLPGHSIYEFIDPVYHAATYMQSYSFPLFPVSDVDYQYTDVGSTILPPYVKKPPGRPKGTKRMKSSGECDKQLVTCSRCKKKGTHNRVTCTAQI